MSYTLSVKNESSLDISKEAFLLSFDTEIITIEDLIKRYVETEVKRAAEVKKTKKPFIVPTVAEQLLNGLKKYSARVPKNEAPTVSIEEYYKTALEGFAKNTYFILVNDRQAQSLAETIVITQTTRVTFIKLIALIGG